MIKKIGTHNGQFHCDEVLACALLKQLPEYKSAEIVRTRDQPILDKCDIVVDVGGVFDHSNKRYDHHQKTFKENFKTLCPDKTWEIKLSSAGLIYVYYGKEILKEMCKKYKSDISIDVLYDKMYENFVLEIDAIDNGIASSDGDPVFLINTNISSRVGQLNPWWNKKSDEQEAFNKAMKLVETEFTDRVNYFANSWWPARQYVSEAIDSRYDVHPSGKILKLSIAGCPWKKHLFSIEKEMFEMNNAVKNGDGSSKYDLVFMLFQDKDTWRVQCIPVDDTHGFENRLPLLKSWCGLRNEELSKESGIPDCIFVHMNGFIGGNKTYDGALQMAVKTLKAAGYLD